MLKRIAVTANMVWMNVVIVAEEVIPKNTNMVGQNKLIRALEVCPYKICDFIRTLLY